MLELAEDIYAWDGDNLADGTGWIGGGHDPVDEDQRVHRVRGVVDCAGGDVGENIFTYRDMIPLPLESRGQAHCDLGIEGSDAHIRLQAAAVKLEMEDVPKYIEHIRPE